MERELSPKLQKLIAMYRQGLPDKQAEIDGAWQSAVAAGWADDETRSLYDVVHKLAGSAGSYGFRELSTVARELDRRLANLVAGEGALDVAAATAEYNEIRAAFARALDASTDPA